MASGSTNPEIADALHLSKHTVKEHTSAVYRKLGVRNRTEAVQRAQRLGLARVASEPVHDAGRSEIARFLALRPPFDALAPEELGGGRRADPDRVSPRRRGDPQRGRRAGHVPARDPQWRASTSRTRTSCSTCSAPATRSGTPRCCRGCRRGSKRARQRTHSATGSRRPSRARCSSGRRSSASSRVGVHEPGHQPVAKLIRAATVTCEPMESIREVGPADDAAGATSAIVELREPRIRDRHRPRHPHADRRGRLAAERPGLDGDDDAGVHGDARPARRRGAVRDARARNPPRTDRQRARRARSASSRTPTCSPFSRGRGSARGERSRARAISMRSPPRRGGCRRSSSTCTPRTCARSRSRACSRRSSTR